MNSLKNLLLIGVSVFSLASFSNTGSDKVVLKDLPPVPSFQVTDAKAKLNCAEIPEALAEYNELARANEEAYSAFVEEISNVIYGWHKVLRKLEGSKAEIPRRTFQPLADGSDQMYEVIAVFNQNTSKLKSRIQVIMQSLPSCL